MKLTTSPDGVLLELRVRPRARPGWDLSGDQPVVAVAAAPVGGAATEEARRALAKRLGVAPARVRLRLGARSRTKVFAIEGVTVDDVRRALARPG